MITLSKPTEWMIEGRNGRATIRLNFTTRNLEMYFCDGSLSDIYSFESIPDLSNALQDAEKTLVSLEAI